MRKNFFVALIAAVALLGATAATALDVVASLNAGGSSVANGFVDNGDGTISSDLTAGDFLVLDITAANPLGELVAGVFTTLSYDSTQLSFAGGNHSDIFQNATCTGFNCVPPALSSVTPAGQKANSPLTLGTGTEGWIQIIGHTSTFQETMGGLPGVRGTGPDVAAQVAFQVLVSGTLEIVLGVGELAGDSVSSGVSSASYTGLVFNPVPVPEPGTALLMGLGLMGLGAAGRRK